MFSDQIDFYEGTWNMESWCRCHGGRPCQIFSRSITGFVNPENVDLEFVESLSPSDHVEFHNQLSFPPFLGDLGRVLNQTAIHVSSIKRSSYSRVVYVSKKQLFVGTHLKLVVIIWIRFFRRYEDFHRIGIE
jgi:hypothetical protein